MPQYLRTPNAPDGKKYMRVARTITAQRKGKGPKKHADSLYFRPKHAYAERYGFSSVIPLPTAKSTKIGTITEAENRRMAQHRTAIDTICETKSTMLDVQAEIEKLLAEGNGRTYKQTLQAIHNHQDRRPSFSDTYSGQVLQFDIPQTVMVETPGWKYWKIS